MKFGQCCCADCTGNSRVYVTVAWQLVGFSPYSGVTFPTSPQNTLYRTETIDYEWYDTDCTTHHTAQKITKYSRAYPNAPFERLYLTTSCDGTVYDRVLADSDYDGTGTDYFNPAIYSGGNCVTPSACIKCVFDSGLGVYVAALKYGDPSFVCPGTATTNTTIDSATSKTITVTRNSDSLVVMKEVHTLSDAITLSDCIDDAQAILDLFDLGGLPITGIPKGLYLSGTTFNLTTCNTSDPKNSCSVVITPVTGAARYGGIAGLGMDNNSWFLDGSGHCQCNGLQFSAAERLYGGGQGTAVSVRLQKSFFPGGAPNCCWIFFPQTFNTTSHVYQVCGDSLTGLPGDQFTTPTPECFTVAPHDPITLIDPPDDPGIIYIGPQNLPPVGGDGQPLECDVPEGCCT
jgi:hypothetical protein